MTSVAYFKQKKPNKQKEMQHCGYPSELTRFVAASHILFAWVAPALITTVAIWPSRSGVIKKQFFLVVYSFYLFFWQFMLYVLQQAVRIARPDPFCPAMLTYGFPSLPAYYVAALGTLAVVLPLLLGQYYGWMSWLMLVCWWFVPPAVLVWFTFNTWQEVLLSMGIGVLATVIYVLAALWIVRPFVPYVINSPPWSWFNLIDTWLQSETQQLLAERLEQSVSRAKQNSSRLALLY